MVSPERKGRRDHARSPRGGVDFFVKQLTETSIKGEGQDNVTFRAESGWGEGGRSRGGFAQEGGKEATLIFATGYRFEGYRVSFARLQKDNSYKSFRSASRTGKEEVRRILKHSELSEEERRGGGVSKVRKSWLAFASRRCERDEWKSGTQAWVNGPGHLGPQVREGGWSATPNAKSI